MKKKLFCLMMCLVLLFQLTACMPIPGTGRLVELVNSAQTASPEEPPAADEKQEEPAGLPEKQEELPAAPAEETQTAPKTSPEEPLAYSGYFYPAVIGDTAYADMESRSWTQADFEPYLQALREAAASGKAEAFHRACMQAWEAMAEIESSYTLTDIRNSADPADEAIAAALTQAQDTYYTAIDLLCECLHQIALSDEKSILSWEFDESYVDYFETYDTESAQESNALADEELTLQLQYETLISEERPDYDALCEVYVQLVRVRKQMAQAAGYDSFADYAYDSYYSRDYVPEQAELIWKTAREDFMPLLQRYAGTVYDVTDTLYDADFIDCSPEKVLEAVEYGARRMSPEVLKAARSLRELGLCDIGYNERKLDTGYTVYLTQYDLPFIFNCGTETYADYMTLFHEFGHFLSFYYNGSDPVFGASDYDLSELQSQGMEVMFLPYYEDIFGSRYADALKAGTVLDMVYSVVDGAMYDEFQQRIFREENLTARRVQEIFREVYDSYGFNRYYGYEYEWMDVIHNFEYPFYYISYAVSAIPALELLVLQQEDAAEAMDSYLRVAAMSDEAYYLSEALQEIGLGSVFSAGFGASVCHALEESGIFSVR